MSYDVLIFDPAHAPAEREAFLQWWDAHEWSSEPHTHNDPAFTTPNLRAWFLEMIERFPALNGPYASSRDQRTADYSIGYHLIYVAMWFDKEAAHRRAHELAGKHGLGLFEASSPDGELWLPGRASLCKGVGRRVVCCEERVERTVIGLLPALLPRAARFPPRRCRSFSCRSSARLGLAHATLHLLIGTRPTSRGFAAPGNR